MKNIFSAIKEAFSELEHVVWPTKNETKTYFIVVVAVLIVFGVFLYIISFGISTGLQNGKDIINPGDSVNPYELTVQPLASDEAAVQDTTTSDQ